MKKFLASVLLAFFVFSVATDTLAEPQWRTCTQCHGTGKCRKCHGKRYVMVWQWRQQRDKNGEKHKVRVQVRQNCSECYWKTSFGKCPNCKGEGRIRV